MTLYSLSIHLTMLMADSSDDGYFNVVGQGGGQSEDWLFFFFSTEHI